MVAPPDENQLCYLTKLIMTIGIW